MRKLLKAEVIKLDVPFATEDDFEKYGSKDFEINTTDAKVTLWQSVGFLSPIEIYCNVKAIEKDGLTTLTFVLPHNPKAGGNWTAELRGIVKKLELPNQVIGKYYAGIE